MISKTVDVDIIKFNHVQAESAVMLSRSILYIVNLIVVTRRPGIVIVASSKHRRMLVRALFTLLSISAFAGFSLHSYYLRSS